MALKFLIKLEFRNVDFLGGRKNRRTQRKTLRARTRTNNKLNTTAPSLLPEGRKRKAIC